jgi:ligand-binding sensor domain-containing protein
MHGLLLALVVLAGSTQWRSYTNTNFVNGIAGTDSTLYVATNGGVVEIATRPWPATKQTYVNTDGLPSNRCLCITRDAHGYLWVGTDGGGLAVLDPDSGFIYRYRPNDLATRIRTMAWDGTRLLVGTDQGLYVIETGDTPLDFDDDVIERFTASRVPELLSDVILSVFCADRYWIGTNLGLSSVTRDFGTWVPYRRPLGDSVRAIGMWRDSLLVGTDAGMAVKTGTGFRPVLLFSKPTAVFQLATRSSRIYLATESGLYEGDGLDSTRFVVSLIDDARAMYFGEALWVGCGGSELDGAGLRYALTGQAWSPFYNNCILSMAVSDCAVGPGGDLYLCHYGAGVSDIKSWGEVQGIWSPLPVPVQVRVDSRGRVWLVHFAGDGGLAGYDPADVTWQKYQWGAQSAWNIIDAFGLDDFDTKWVFNGGAAIVAVDSTGQSTPFEVPGLAPPPGGLYEIAFDSRHRVWLGLTVGLVMVDYAGTLRDGTDDRDTILVTGLPSSEVRSVAVDHEDNVWAATSQGVARWDGTAFRVFTVANSGILANNAYRIRVDASDRVWILTEDGLSIYDQITDDWSNHTPQNSGLIANTQGIVGFYSALALSDRLGLAIIGTQRGVSVFDYSVPPESTADHILVYPNPCALGVHAGVCIDKLPYDATGVRVLTLSGRPVAELDIEQARHQAVWRPTGKASGIYLLVVDTPRGVRVERVAVVRP